MKVFFECLLLGLLAIVALWGVLGAAQASHVLWALAWAIGLLASGIAFYHRLMRYLEHGE